MHRFLVWCARPDTLNDPQEFVWQCDYTPTPATVALLTGVFGQGARRDEHGRTGDCGNRDSERTPRSHRQPRFRRHDRANVATKLASLASARRLTIPPSGGGTEVTARAFVSNSRFQQTCSGRSFTEWNILRKSAFTLTNLCVPLSTVTKRRLSTRWHSFRSRVLGQTKRRFAFVSQRHSIVVAIDRAHVPCVFLGDSLGADVRARIERIPGQVPLAERGR